MDKVYLVYKDNNMTYEDHMYWVVAVCATKQAAQQYIEEATELDDINQEGYPLEYFTYEIKEMEVIK